MSNWRNEVIAEARTWKGTPYQHRGRVKGVGVDCGGLLYCVYSPYTQLKPFPKGYAQDWALHQDKEIYLDYIKPYTVEVSTPRIGGMALFKVGRCWSHAAIVTEKRTFIHAWGRTQEGCVIESRIGFFRIGNGGKPREVRFFDLDI